MRAEEAAEQGRLRFVAVLGGANASGMKLRGMVRAPGRRAAGAGAAQGGVLAGVRGSVVRGEGPCEAQAAAMDVAASRSGRSRGADADRRT